MAISIKVPELKLTPKLLATALAAVVVIIAVTVAVYFYWRYQQLASQDPAREIAKIVKEVSALMDLPDETPTIATVTEKEKLANQSFFEKAENGDKVLLFVENKKVILYRPSSKKIIDVTTASLTSESDASKLSGTESAQAPQNFTLAIYNGSTVSGLTRRIEDRIKEGIAGGEVLIRDNAKQTAYAKSLVIDVSGKATAQAQKLAELLQGEVGTLPEGENKPNVDIIIIGGANFQ